MTSISRGNNTRSRSSASTLRAQRVLRLDAMTPKRRDDLGADETARTRDWFRTSRNGLGDAIDDVDAALPRARSDDKAGLIDLRTDLVGRLTDLRQKEEAFFAENNVTLRPPPQDVIDETLRLTTALGKRIAAEKRAQAVVALLNDLAGLAARVLG